MAKVWERTKGEAVPLFGIPARSPMNVAIVATEDDWATVVAPRLIVAGVDMKRVYVISSYEDGAGSPTFPDNMNLIPEDVGMIVVDAWLDTVNDEWLDELGDGVPFWQMLAHVANHGTQHRSEAAVLLTEAGRSPGDLDMIFFAEELAQTSA